jgi:hypothetical protein
MSFNSDWVGNDQLVGNGLNKSLPTNWSGREKTYSELSVSLGQVAILRMGVRQGVSSGSDGQVGSSSQSTVGQTNSDKDEMEEVVDEEEEEEEEGEEKETEEEEGEPCVHPALPPSPKFP